MNRMCPILVLFAPLLLGAAVPSPEADYAERAAKLEGKKDAKAWLKLADFAEENLLWEKREEALRKAVEVDPKNAEAHARLDEVKVGQDWLPADEIEAKEAEEKQAKGLVFYGAKWISSKEADKLREADRKAVGWPMELRLDTPHLRIYSAKPLPFTRRLAALLESEIGVYEKLYGKVLMLDPKPLTFRVYVFSDRVIFLRILTQDTGYSPEDSGITGIYSNVTQILYVGRLATIDSEGDVLQVAVHEMTHALDDLAAHIATVGLKCPWLTEGRADHLAYSIRGRRILPGATTFPSIDGKLVTLAKSIDGADLRNVMGLDHKTFMGTEGRRNYAISWAWIHFLFHGEGGKYASGFRNYLQGIPKKVSIADFEKAVGPLSDLEPAFKRYVKETLIPMAEKDRVTP